MKRKPDSMPSSEINIWLNGLTGRMGQELVQLLRAEVPQQGLTLLGGFSAGFLGNLSSDQTAMTSSCKLFIDFSTAEGNRDFLAFFEKCKMQEKKVLIGTTGLDQATEERWKTLAAKCGLGVLFAPNTSLGISLLLRSAMEMVGIASRSGFDIEVVETHHRRKKDAPSGTARLLTAGLNRRQSELRVTEFRKGPRQENEIGVHAVRGGGIFGEHTIRFLGEHEEIALTHRAFSRQLFAQGALVLSRWLCQQKAGVYTLFDVDLSDLI